MGRVLSAFAMDLRTRRRQEATERAQAAVVKMLFPMVLCILPATFIIVLGPALASHLHAPASLSGWFIAALGAGTVVGSLRPSRHDPSLRLAATALAALAATEDAHILFSAPLGRRPLRSPALLQSMKSRGFHRTYRREAVEESADRGWRDLLSLTHGNLGDVGQRPGLRGQQGPRLDV